MSGAKGENVHRKNSNPEAWDKIENEKPAKAFVVPKDYSGTDDTDDAEFDVMSDSDEELELTESHTLDDDNYKEDFSDVIQLTQYNDSLLKPSNENYTIAEYTEIDTTELSLKHKKFAASFVSKITDFILKFNDVSLTAEHTKYIKQVGRLQVQHLEDMLYMVDVNKQMLNNIINRVNATQAEDYAILNAYNNLANQHLKLIKELQSTYRSIPNVLKKMKTDVLCNQELLGDGDDEELITEDYNKTQFNNSKQMLKQILDKKNAKSNEKDEI